MRQFLKRFAFIGILAVLSGCNAVDYLERQTLIEHQLKPYKEMLHAGEIEAHEYRRIERQVRDMPQGSMKLNVPDASDIPDVDMPEVAIREPQPADRPLIEIQTKASSEPKVTTYDAPSGTVVTQPAQPYRPTPVTTDPVMHDDPDELPMAITYPMDSDIPNPPAPSSRLRGSATPTTQPLPAPQTATQPTMAPQTATQPSTTPQTDKSSTLKQERIEIIETDVGPRIRIHLD